MKLTDNQQALLMFLALALPSIILWLTSSEPLFTEPSLRILLAGILGGLIAFIKEIADYKPKEEST